jgi:hypothetical protein
MAKKGGKKGAKKDKTEVEVSLLTDALMSYMYM